MGCYLAEYHELWQQVHDWLRLKLPVALLVVVESAGSSPGKAGAKAALKARGDLIGTIGGGLVEYRLVEEARKFLQLGKKLCILRHLVHDETVSADRSGMICGGSQSVAICLFTSQDLPIIECLIQLLRQRMPGLLQLTPTGTSLIPGRTRNQKYYFAYESQEKWLYEERLDMGHIAYLVGGGHVSLALSRILATLDFRIVVFEERPHRTSFIKNTYAHEKTVTSYEKICEQIPEGNQSHVVIMTSFHRTDERVLRQLINRRFRYLGMLGSQTKVKKLFASLPQTVSTESLRHIHAPIGLPIHSHTPEEIAVSIAAEMVKVKNS